jgi:hypothetical protein
MSNVLIKATGEILKSVHTPDYLTDEYIVNPTPEEIEQYAPVIPDTSAIDEALMALQETDYEVSRAIEDIYDALPEEVKANIPQETKDKIQNKKTKRAEYLALL